MHDFPFDEILFGPNDVEPEKLPIAKATGRETFVLGTFNPGLCRLPAGNLLMMVRVAEALKSPQVGDTVEVLRFDGHTNSFTTDSHPAAEIDFSDPRKYRFKKLGQVYALTSMSWLLPVELDAQGTEVVRVHYDKMILPENVSQEYGVEDARITQIGETFYMTTCAVSSGRHSTILYTSDDGLNYKYEGLILDHQNKDMVLFPEKIYGMYHALTRPQGELYFVDSDAAMIPGPGINISSSPDLLHWRPRESVLARPRNNSLLSRKVGGGAPPIKTPQGWLVLFHGVDNEGLAGVYRTVWMLLDLENPEQIILEQIVEPLMEAKPALTRNYQDSIYLADIVFTSGIVADEYHYVVASGELDLCCRITHIPHSSFTIN